MSREPDGALGDLGAWLDLPEGSDLDLPLAERVTRAGISRVVVLAGSADSGKTTLVTALYELFQNGPFAGYLFAGSETLPAFERRCHLGRIDSGRPMAETARTLAGSEPRWLHLRVRRASPASEAKDVLLSEISADAFRLAKDSTDESRRLTLCRRADHFVVLVDGARLVSRQTRLAAANDPAMLLRSLLDADMLRRSSFVEVVLTKWDRVVASAAATEVEEFVAAFADKTRQHCEARLGRLRFVRVAARPAPAASLPYGHGLAGLFTAWVEESPALIAPPPDTIAMAVGASEFDRYLWRRLPALRPAPAGDVGWRAPDGGAPAPATSGGAP